MALDWTWAFGAESAVVLETMGWDFSSTAVAAAEPRTTQQYTYAGSPTRYSMAMDHTVYFQIPTVTSAPQGWLAIAVYHEVGAPPFANQEMLQAIGAVNSRTISARSLGTGALSLYVDNTFKASTSIITWAGQWHYVALRYDFSTTTYSGQIWVDGVAETGVETDAASLAETGAIFRFESSAQGDRAHYVAQIAVWNDLADPGQAARFVTRLDVDADVSEVGTWTPSAGVTNHGVVGGTFDAATYTEEAVPSASDDVIVNLSTDLATKLGVSPTNIDGVTCHTFSTGLGQTARAEVGDQAGATTTTGATGAISSSTTARHATAPTKPSGGAWSGSDTPKAKYFIVTV
jgi:hypothetical protein